MQCGWSVRLSHARHVLIERSTDADVTLDGEDDDDPGRCETEDVRGQPVH